jgi:hypothetical protein
VPTIVDEPSPVNPALIDALERAIWTRAARRQPGGEVRFRCPLDGHADIHPSARWSRKGGGVWFCDPCGRGGGALQLAQLLGVDLPVMFNIQAADGTTVAVHERTGDGPGKRMRWRRPTGELGLGGAPLTTLPLYHSETLAQLEPGERVVLVEGEKCADHLRGHNILAVGTVTGSSKTPSDDSLRVLSGHEVICWPDADDFGRQHMAKIAARLEALEVPHAIVDPWPERTDGSDAADFTGSDEELQAVLDAATTNANPDVKLELGVIDAASLLAEPDEDVDWLVEGLLPAGGLSLLIAKPKAGKSTLARAVAVAVTRGEPFLGRKTLAGPALYVTTEDKRADVKHHLRLLRADNRLLVRIGPPETTDPVAWLRQVIDQHHCRLVVLDPLARFTRIPDLNDYAKVTQATGPLIALAHETGTHTLWVHHAGKGERVAIDASLGSTALAGFVDTILLVRRHGDGLRSLETIQRSGDDLAETTIRLDSHAGTLALAGTVEFQQIRTATALILEALVEVSLTEDEIRERVTCDNIIIGKALRQAHAADDVVRTGRGVKGDPFRYRLPATPDEEREKKDLSPHLQAGTRPKGESENGSRFCPFSLRVPDPSAPPPTLKQGEACSKRRDEPDPEPPGIRRVRL